MGLRGSYYGGIVLDGLIFHIDAAKQESYAKRGLRYMQAGNSNAFLDFADTYKSPSVANATGAIVNGATFSNFAPYHLSDYTTPYLHNPASSAWKDSAGIGTFYGNIEFDGSNDYIGFGLTPEMNGFTDITVSVWFYINKFKPGVSPSGGTASMVVSRYNELTTNGWSILYDNQGVVYFGGREDGSLYISVTASITVKQSIDKLEESANGGWYNVVGTKQENVWNIYVAETNRYVVNGDSNVYVGPGQQSLLGTRTMGGGTTPFTTNNLYIGCAAFGGGVPIYHMNGRMMSLSVYNRALSLSEINQNYDSFTKRIVSSTVPVLPSDGTEFITVWDTSIPVWIDPDTPGLAKTIEIPINDSYTYNYTVDWGDGNTTTGETGNTTHTYAVDGIYTVKITGTFPAIMEYISPYNVRMTEVSQWGLNVWQSMELAFEKCSNMNVTATDSPNLSVVTSMRSMFGFCTSMNGVIGGWDVSNVEDMRNMFWGCSSFDQPLNSWNTGSVLYMQSMFQGAASFNQPLNSWNTAAVISMSGMFYEAILFNQNISAWNTAAVTEMDSMFAGQDAPTSFNNGGQPMLTNGNSWNTGAVTNMSAMFDQASSFNVDISNWNTAAVTEMSSMFYEASAFNQNISAWNTAAVTGMDSMFYKASTFNQNISAWNTAAVNAMGSMFAYATLFNNGGQPMLTNGNSWNTAAVTNMSAMFYEAFAFNADISNWNTALVYNMGGMFSFATSFDQPLNSWNTITVFNMTSMFEGATSFNRPIGSWNTVNVNYMSSMFWGATLFNQNISAWNTAQVQDMGGMFFSSGFNNGGQPMPTNGNSWNTAAVRGMTNMFNQAKIFNQNIATWNTSSVLSMRQMFYGAEVFNNGGQPMPTNGNSWNTTNVTDMWGMFYGTVFNQNIATWNTAAVRDMGSMFKEDFVFNNGGQPMPRSGNSWNTALVTDMSGMFQSADAFNQNIGNWQVGNVLDLTNFMATKTPTTFSTTNLNAIYNGWSTQTLKPNLVISFGTAKYTSAATAGRNILTSSPKLWQITDGGI